MTDRWTILEEAPATLADVHARGVNTNWLPALPTADGKRMLPEAKAGAPATVIEIASGRVLFIFAFPWRIRRGTRAQRKT